jgi:hypothetical protein
MAQIVFVLMIVLLCPLNAGAQNNMQLKRRWIAAGQLPYYTDKDFPRLVRDGVLVKIVDDKYHVIDSRLDFDAQYVRPYVLRELRPFELAFYAKFKHPIRINAAFRTIEHHADLRRRNPNAARGNSPHSTGSTIDISLIAMTKAERRFTERWFRARHRKSVVFTIERFPLTMYDVFFRPPRLPARPRHPHRGRKR